MKLSGYNGGFRSKVIAEGLRGHMKKVVKSFQDGSSFNRSGEEIRSLKSARRRTDRDWFRKDAIPGQLKDAVTWNVFHAPPAARCCSHVGFLVQNIAYTVQCVSPQVLLPSTGCPKKTGISGNRPYNNILHEN